MGKIWSRWALFSCTNRDRRRLQTSNHRPDIGVVDLRAEFIGIISAFTDGPLSVSASTVICFFGSHIATAASIARRHCLERPHRYARVFNIKRC